MAASLSTDWQAEDQAIRVDNRRAWWWVYSNAVVNVALIVLLIVVALHPHIMPWPYVLAVNDPSRAKGEIVGMGQPILSTASLDDATKRWALKLFLHRVFTVIPNVAEEKEDMHDAMAFTCGQAYDKFKAHLTDGVHTPEIVIQTGWQDVQNIDVLSQPSIPDSYQATWQTTLHATGDLTPPVTTQWRGTFGLAAGMSSGCVPSNPDELRKLQARNPLLLFITAADFNPEGVK